MTKIEIVSGFLGAGKTTLIKKLLKEAFAGEKLVLIENEFGEIGVDGGFLKEAGIEITEMNSGCICCSLVGDFGTALKEVLEKYKTSSVGEVLYSDGDLVMRIVRDLLNYDVESVIVADEEIYNRLKNLPKSLGKVLKKLVLYEEKRDMFKTYNITQEIEKLLHNRVNLSSGAYFIIDRTEALTVIDVNTGSFVGEEKLEDTVFVCIVQSGNYLKVANVVFRLREQENITLDTTDTPEVLAFEIRPCAPTEYL